MSQTLYLYSIPPFFSVISGALLCSTESASDSLLTLFIIPVVTAIIGAAAGYYFARKNLRFERNADFQKMLDEEQLHAHKKLYAAVIGVSIRKENPFAMAFKQKDGKVLLRRSQAVEFVKDITAFLSSEDGAFIDRKLSHPLWGLRNLVYAILDFEKNTNTAEIELIKKGQELVNYIDEFRNNFRSRFQLRDRQIINIEPE